MGSSPAPSRSSQSTLPRAIDAEPRRVDLGDVGAVGYYASIASSDPATPALVLVHGVHVAASSADVRPLFDAFRDRNVYALDWPGFGMSDRGDRAYTPELYARALERFLSTVEPTGAPADIVALSLGAEFAARTALEHPELVRSLVMISPTGLARNSGPPERIATVAHQLEKSPRLAELLFSTLTSRASIRYCLNKSFHGPGDPKLVDHAVETARQPDARFAPFAFLRGDLFTRDVYDSLYRRLRVPSFVLYDRDPYTSFERLPQLTRENPFLRSLRIEPTQGLPHFEQLTQVELAVRSFYDAIEAAEEVENRIDTVPLPENIGAASEGFYPTASSRSGH